MSCRALCRGGAERKLQEMKPDPAPLSRTSLMTAILAVLALAPALARSEPTAAAAAAFNFYIEGAEARLGRMHASASAFLAPVDGVRLHHGEVVIEELTP